MTSDHQLAVWDGAYLFGALTWHEAAEYERFLAADPTRMAALGRYWGIPAILDALPAEEAFALLYERATAPPVPAVAGAVVVRRRRAGLAIGFTAAAASLLIGVVVGYAAVPRPSQADVALQAMTVGPRDGVSASLAVTGEQWGTRLRWSCEYTKNWASMVSGYDLVVTTRTGAESVVASWRPSGRETADLAAATVIPISDIRTVAIRQTGTTTPLAWSALG